ncbi:pentapeptide repeat-containing protein [Chondrinema litorale]|uniref:pentapeptide repeat-containing protein n=1 Tax=Chondrinema litorale TaxID=2994555 RepID=UPI0025439437|nr:pentapeptide repeat-containing protein [Chondrinema litorale]UZR98631.1 pentapeptide repeat-containing protein [Chondrinema litorale]
MKRHGKYYQRIQAIQKLQYSRLIRLIQTPIGITVVVGLFLIIIISVLDIRYLETSNGKDILIEAHGLLFDIFVFGVLLAYLNKFLEKKQKSERYQEEIDDFRGWEEKEAKYRIVGNIKRLNKIGYGRINLSNCYLAHADLHQANLVKANLKGVDLSYADLRNADLSYSNLSDADLSGADLSNALLRGVNLSNAKLNNTNLSRTSLWRAKLIGTELSGAKLKKTNLMETDLTNAKLSEAFFEDVNLDHAEMDKDLRKAIKEAKQSLPDSGI